MTKGEGSGWSPAPAAVPAGRRSAPLVLGAVATTVVAGLLVAVLGSGFATPARVRDLDAARLIAEDPDGALAFSGSPPAGPWDDLRGRWTHDGHSIAMVSPPGPTIALTVVDAGADARVGVTLEPLRDEAGLVFRVADARNYWAVAPSVTLRAWLLVRVRNGRLSTAASSRALFGSRARVEVRLHGSSIDIWLNGRYLMGTIDGHLQHQERAGVAVRGPGGRTARWLDFRVAHDV